MTRLVRPDAVLVQAVIAGALSFAHLHDLAEAAGQNGWKAWAYPVSVDLLLVAAWHRLRTLRDAGEPSRSAWSWFAVALAASLGANVATAGLLDLGDVPDWLRILVAGWPALAFLGGTLLVHRPTSPGEPETAPAPESLPVVERATEPDVQVVSAPALPAPDPEPDPAPAAAPAITAPPALIAHARKIAADYRTRTGSDIDTETLRARLGVPSPLAEAIAAQLA
ncbi:DUF2637 domain-containing protein [Streptomyces sp. NBC_00513]|uniref:DUF2637 domain-containing protein n=1 Tax=unclassified Streptomyces TaxID=2593676 RepID=UPI00225AB919|nr:DUF2637 domain-containing protein [Streptomyces sp. NBC_00424]MCX5075613.1 DUF2637 domain-containing protein [Streptomyces sp. NBC_00424]WUD41287.1 DUF2637 domain-containing protein [Streptomyces sp. NBC_00513]